MARTTTFPSVRECGVCGRVRKIKRAAVDDDPDMCQACWARDERSWRTCSRCGQTRCNQGRDRDTGEPICGPCYRRARPAGICDSCGQTKQLARTGVRGGRKLCGACAERERRPKRACGRCGRIAPIALLVAADGTRDLCFACYAKEPRRVCGGCGELAAIRVRGRDGKPDLCQRCYRPPIARCSVCDRDKPCAYADTDAPLCWSCKPRRVDCCAACGEQRPIKARSAIGPLCARCEWRRLRAKAPCERCGRLCRPAIHEAREVLCGDCAGIAQTRVCTSCGAEDITYDRGLCPACTLQKRLDALRADAPPAVIATLEPHLRSIEQTPNPLAKVQWLAKPAGQLLASLARGEVDLTHDALDALPTAKSVDQLRATLVHAGLLPARDELLARLERWTTERLDAIEPGADRTTLRQFATWKIQRELAARRRLSGSSGVLAATMPRHWVTAAISVTAWLHERSLTLTDLDQSLLDEWLDGGASRRHVAKFIAWLERQRGVHALRVPPRPSSTAVIALPDRQRLDALRKLLDNDELDDHLRVAGCLIALYAQPAARIVRLTADHLTINRETAIVRLGEPVPLPTALRDPASRMLTRATEASGERWLFPGQKAGQPTHPAHLSRRLRGLGVPSLPARSSALAALAHRIPAPVLAELLGLHAHTVASASAQLKVDYANYVAHRT